MRSSVSVSVVVQLRFGQILATDVRIRAEPWHGFVGFTSVASVLPTDVGGSMLYCNME